MPTRSSGCLTCRKRKIRCDEGRPGCKRCETHGVPCPGYRTDKPGGIEFKDQTSVTKQKAKEQYRVKLAQRTAAEEAILENRTASSINHGSSSPESSFNIDDRTSQSSSSSKWKVELESLPSGSQALILANDRRGLNGHRDSLSRPVSIRSPSTERAALYNHFIDNYLPKVHNGAQNGHFSFFQTIAEKSSMQPALQQGLDSLSLVQMGSLHKDQAIVKQAVRQYGNALNSLARSISKGEFLYDDDVLAAVTVLATCELYAEISKMGPGWGNHVQGANQLVALRGPDSIQSELALLLYSNMRHGALIHALIARKAPFMATPEWREVAFRVPRAIRDSSTTFYDIAIQIPGLLERHDSLHLESADALAEIDSVLAESSQLENELRDWFAAWQSVAIITSPIGASLYEVCPIEDFPTFCSLCPDRTFQEAYMFPDFLVAYLHSLYWMVMHYLRTNTQSLQRHRHWILRDWYPSEESAVTENELLGYIINLCHCMPFFVEPISSSTGSVGIFLPLRRAATYFTAHGHWEWLKWIGSVRTTVFVRGLAPPDVNKQAGQSGKVSPGP